MYIFSRSRAIDVGRSADAMRMATELAAKASEVTGVPLNTWYQGFAPTGPAIVWTARFDHLQDLDDAFGAVTASADYQDATAEMDEYLTGVTTDAMVQVVAGTPPAELTPVINTVMATAAQGHYRAALHWGADLAERFARSMDIPTIFARSLWGHYGTVGWASYFADASEVETTQNKMAADEMLQAVIDEGAHNVQPGAVSTWMRRLN